MSRIKIDRDRVLGLINKNIFGGLVEHAKTTVYGGIVDYDHPLADEDGSRSDVLEALRGMNVSLLRWPGGNFASGYHWENGIGPADKRPVCYDLEWQVEESNRFGTDEFLRFCKKIGAAPYLCVNAGHANAEEAAHWVEYCNLKGNSHYAKLRETNGHPEPYGVKYWGIGNELYGRGQIGRKDIGPYIDCVKEYARMMKKVDPTIKLIVVGWEKAEWNFRLVKEAGEYFDYISVHTYYVGNAAKPLAETAAYSILTAEQLYEMKSAIDAASFYIKDRKRKPIEIAFDEWNMREWWHEKFIEWLTTAFDYNTYNRELQRVQSDLIGSDGIKSREDMLRFITQKRNRESMVNMIDMSDAIYTACALHAVYRMCDRVTMAAFSPIINGQGPVDVFPDGLQKRTTYQVLKMYSEHVGEKALNVFVDCPSYSVYVDSVVYNTNRYIDVPYLDVGASFSEMEKKLYVSVVNRNEKECETAALLLDGFKVIAAELYELARGAEDTICARTLSSQDLSTLTFSPCSVTLISLKFE